MLCMHTPLYFDNAATTSISQSALASYEEVAGRMIGNPSALHPLGRDAHALLEESRTLAAGLLKVPAQHLTFTSGATEANAIVHNSLIWRSQPAHVVMSNIEHPSIKEYERIYKHLGWTISFLNAPNGFVQPQDLAKVLTKQTRLVSIMLVNNVVGSIQDVKALVEVVRRFERDQGGRKIHFHTDATQALGKIPFDLTELGVDSASFSAHKFHGPRGIGILYNTDASIEALSRGGDQEAGLRPGTENLAAIVSMTTALKEAIQNLDEQYEQVKQINAQLRDALSFLPILSPLHTCSPYILTFAAMKLPSEVFTRMLYDRGFCVSSGSACSNNARHKGESVLAAMQYQPKQRASSIRLSFSKDTTQAEADALAKAIISLYQEHP